MVRPRVSTNFAISADGKISSSPPRPSGWTSAADHARFMELRKSADAIMVGRGTLDADHMTMTVPGKSRQPLRCIVSRSGKLDPAHPIFQRAGGEIHLLVTGETQPPPIPGVTVHHQSLAAFLTTLATEYGVERLHCEGGGQLVRALAELDALDEFHLTLAGHTIFGGLHAPTTTGVPGEFLPASLAFTLRHFEPRESECFLTYVRSASR